MEKTSQSPAKIKVVTALLLMLQYSGVLHRTDWNTVTDVAEECCAFIFGTRQSPFSPLFKVFHMQRTIISSHFPYFTHSFTFIHSYQQPHFHKSGRATETYSRKTEQQISEEVV
jgi:hypothetical protein